MPSEVSLTKKKCVKIFKNSTSVSLQSAKIVNISGQVSGIFAKGLLDIHQPKNTP